MSSKNAQDKLKDLKEYIAGLSSSAVGFSGGVDSTFLLAVAREVLKEKVLAITCSAVFVPEREQKEAKQFCAERGIPQIICRVNPLEDERVRFNDPKRCYFCKQKIFSEIRRLADEKGLLHVAEGSNMDDLSDYRPGMRAVKELGIKSPLQKADLYKNEIRLLSKEMGLPTWDKPAYACLASRFVYGEEITEEKLRMVDAAEQILIDHGFTQERVRVHGTMARIEVPENEIARLASGKMRKALCEELKQIGFSFVTLDLSGYRTGSMNAAILQEAPHAAEE